MSQLNWNLKWVKGFETFEKNINDQRYSLINIGLGYIATQNKNNKDSDPTCINTTSYVNNLKGINSKLNTRRNMTQQK